MLIFDCLRQSQFKKGIEWLYLQNIMNFDFQSFSGEEECFFDGCQSPVELLDLPEQEDNYQPVSDCDYFLVFDYEKKLSKELPKTDTGLLNDFHHDYIEVEKYSSEIEISATPVIPHQKESSILPLSSGRFSQKIMVNTDDLLLKRKVEQGTRTQTKNICKHLHTETAKFLKNMYQLSQLSQEEAEIAKNFSESKVCIQNFHNLFKIERLAFLCRDYYESKTFLTEILRSKMDMKTKKTLVKYLNKFQMLTVDRDFKSWKKLAK